MVVTVDSNESYWEAKKTKNRFCKGEKKEYFHDRCTSFLFILTGSGKQGQVKGDESGEQNMANPKKPQRRKGTTHSLGGEANEKPAKGEYRTWQEKKRKLTICQRENENERRNPTCIKKNNNHKT